MLRAAIFALITILMPGAARAQEPADPGVAAFKRGYEAELRRNGVVSGKCTYDVIGREGGGPGVIIRLDCERAPNTCDIVIYDAADASGREDNFDLLGCRPKPPVSRI